MIPDSLRGRRAVITGSSRGFGYAVALAYVRAGAAVMLTARTESELREARASLLAAQPDARVEMIACDISLEADVDALARAARSTLGGTDILVCNAGIYGPKGPIESIDYAAWAQAIAINLNGVVLSVRAFAEQLKAAQRGKVIILSGGGATKPMPNLSAYAASKAAVVRFGETLAEEWRRHGIDVNSVAPGALNTRLLDEVIAAGPGAVGEAFYAASLEQQERGGAPLERGAALCVYLGSRASDDITAKLISAIWDPWERFDDLREPLATTDVLTLRRIVPEDRGMTW